MTPTLTKRALLASTFGLLATSALGCNQDPAASPAGERPANLDATGALTADEAAGLIFMRDEEKLARDVYLTLGQSYDLPVFRNISSSEQRHMDAVLRLLDLYGLEDPVAGLEVGQLHHPQLQALHDDLIASGQQSLEAALRAGALIEETDIEDLRSRNADTNEDAIHVVYDNLERGSHNHLRAFTWQLERIGAIYQPQLLSQSDYDAILAESRGRRGGRGGRGGRWR